MRSTVLSLVVVTSIGPGCRPPSATPPGFEDDHAGPMTRAPKDEVEHIAKLVHDGKLDEARTRVDAALAKAPNDAELHYTKGVVEQERGDRAAALAAYGEAARLEPKFHPAWNGIGALKLDAGDAAGAIEAFRAAIEAKPAFADAHYNLALALRGAGKADEALASLETAAGLAPEDPAIQVELARTLEDRGDRAGAVGAAERAVAAAPEDRDARLTYGRLLLEADRAKEAVAQLEAARARAPDDGEIGLYLARALLRERPRDAVVLLEQLAARFPDKGFLYSDWGVALAKQGDSAGALVKFDRALQLDPDATDTRVRRIGALASLHRCKEAKAEADKLKGRTKDAAAIAEGQAAAKACR